MDEFDELVERITKPDLDITEQLLLITKMQKDLSQQMTDGLKALADVKLENMQHAALLQSVQEPQDAKQGGGGSFEVNLGGVAPSYSDVFSFRSVSVPRMPTTSASEKKESRQGPMYEA